MPTQPQLTPELQASIVQAVSVGVPYLKAAMLAGVSHTTAYEWRQRGEGRHRRRTTRLLADFADAIKKAEAQDQARRVARIEQAARGGVVIYEKTITTEKPDGSRVTVREVKTLPPQWTADAWHLERTDPKRWGRRDRVDFHSYREQVHRKAHELADRFGLDADDVIARAEALANGLEGAEGDG